MGSEGDKGGRGGAPKILPWFAMPNLILIPTAFERDRLLPALQCEVTSSIDAIDWRIELCGFGLVAAAARTAEWIAKVRPQHVVLMGIAGSYGDTVAVGEACCFDAVRCMGIGVGSLDQDSYRSAEALGWPQVVLEGASPESIGDELKLFHHGEACSEGLLLSVTGAAANRDHAAKTCCDVSQGRCGRHGRLCGGVGM